MSDFEERGVRLVAVSVDAPDKLTVMRDASGAQFDFLSDPDGALLDIFGVRHVDGMPDQDIAQSAVFLVDQTGTLVWKKVAENYRVRPRPDEILGAADRLLNAG